MPLLRPEALALRARSFGFSVVLWIFGFFTTVLLIGLWGRTVAADEATLEASAKAVLESELVNDRVEDWLTEGLSTATATTPEDVSGAVRRIASSPEVRRVIDDLVDQSVSAALAPAGAETRIDLTASVEAALPVVIESLGDEGIETDPGAIRAAVLAAPDLVLASDGNQRVVADTVRNAGGFLTKVSLVGLAGIILSGAAAVAMSRDRTRQVRELATKLSLSAMTFALMLRVGGWAVDPSGGRSPVARGGAVLLRSNGHVFAYVAVIALALAVGSSAMLLRRRRRLAFGARSDLEPDGAAGIREPATTGA